jgi:hypothetical protein
VRVLPNRSRPLRATAGSCLRLIAAPIGSRDAGESARPLATAMVMGAADRVVRLGRYISNPQRPVLAKLCPFELGLGTTEFPLRPDIELRFDRFRLSSRLAIGRPGQAGRDPIRTSRPSVVEIQVPGAGI